MKNLSKLKETYRLWVEYLKESAAYKQYCKKQKKATFTPWPIEKVYWYCWNLMKNDSTLALKYQHKFFGIYVVFGNVHAKSYNFEQWWNDVMLKLIALYDKDPYVVLKIDDALRWYIDEITMHLMTVFDSSLEDKVKKEYLQATIEEALKHYFNEQEGLVCLLAYPHHPKEELVKRFTDTITAHKTRYGITEDEEKKFLHQFIPMPMAKRLTSELDKYLNVYRLTRQGVKWIDIVRQVSPKSTYIVLNKKGTREVVDISAQRLFQLYKEKAKKIIKNTENGTFPGEY